MPVTVQHVRSLAESFVQSTEKLTAKEREQRPSGAYGNNFNNVLHLAKEAAPQIDDRLWPKPVEVYEVAFHDGSCTRSRYSELETYARQILSLLPQTT